MAKTRCVCSTSAAVGFMPPLAPEITMGAKGGRTHQADRPSDRLPPSRSPSRVLGFRSLKFLPADIRFTLTGNKANRMIVA